MAIDSDVKIVNMALARLGDHQLIALKDEQRVNLQNVYDQIRDELLSGYPWPFALKRVRLTAAGILDCSAITITFADADPDTIADSGSAFLTSGFLDDDIVGVKGSGSNDADLKINTAVAATLTLETAEEVTAEVLTNDTDLKLYAKPAYNWNHKYAIPSDNMRVHSVEENTNEETDDPTWEVEGDYIVTDAIDEDDQVRMRYVQQITDVTKFSTLFVTCLVLLIASRIAKPMGSDEGNKLLVEFNNTILDVFAITAGSGNPDKTRKNTSWQAR